MTSGLKFLYRLTKTVKLLSIEQIQNMAHTLTDNFKLVVEVHAINWELTGSNVNVGNVALVSVLIINCWLQSTCIFVLFVKEIELVM